jgi:hypothetical protein
MPTSEAQIRANQANGARSKGPLTAETRAISSRNSLKHGMTGAGVVLLEEDISEVERLSLAFEKEFDANGEAGRALARRMAVSAVRMDRSVVQEFAARDEFVRKTLDDFIPPEGVDAQTAEKLRVEAGKIALFDASKPACLARKYEAAAERCFFRSLKELRELKKRPNVESLAAQATAQANASMAKLGSFLPAPSKPQPSASKPIPTPPKPSLPPTKASLAAWDPSSTSHFDLPISIGRLC